MTRDLRFSQSSPEQGRRASAAVHVILTAALSFAAVGAPRSSFAASVGGMLESGLRIIETNYLFAEELDATRLLGSSLEFVETAIPQVQAHAALGGGYVIAAGDCELRLEVRDGASLTALATPLAAAAELIAQCVRELPENSPSPAAMLLNGVLAGLDPYSTVFDSRGKTEHTIQFRGTLAGIGARIGIRRDTLTLLTVYPDSPAARAGLHDMDRVVRIDGVSTVSMLVTDAVEKIRGAVDTDVVLTIARDGAAAPIEIAVKRGLVTIPSVEARLLRSGNIYAAISHFSQTTPDDFRVHVQKLMGANRRRGVIIDLRANSGGSMLGSSEIANTFLDEGLLITTAGRHGSHVAGLTEEVRANSTTPFRDSPVIILTSPRTASGSELMAASLRNNDRAIFVGERSFGKGTVQKTYALGADEALKLTVGKFLPKGLAIPAGGLVPDVEIRTLLVTKTGYRLPLTRRPVEEMKFWQCNPPWVTAEPARTPTVLTFVRDVPDVPNDGEDEDLPPDDPLEDPAVTIADEILARFGATSASRMVADAAPFLNERSAHAIAEVAHTLADKGVDWSAEIDSTPAGEPVAAPLVHVELNPESQVLRAGAEATVELRVTNEGSRPLYRVFAVLDSEIGFLRGLGVLIGRIDPGVTVKRTLSIKPPVEFRLARLTTSVVIESGTAVLGRYGPYSLIIDETNRPLLAHRASVSRSETADIIELHVEVANRGTAPSGEIRLQLQQPEAGIAELVEGTMTFPPLAPGAIVDTRLHVKLLTSTAEPPTVDLIIYDTEFRSLVESKPRLVEAEGSWLVPPQIELSRIKAGSGADGVGHTIVATVTDERGIVQVRASVDGNRVAFLDLSGRPAASQSAILPWAAAGASKRYEIIATDTDGLIARYVTEL